MDASQLQRAQTELDRAYQSLDELAATKHPAQIAFHWANFLVAFERIFTRLGAAAGGKGDAWFGPKEKYRRAETLLCYLHQARNADEHGLTAVLEPRPGFIRQVGAEPMNWQRLDAGVRLTLEIQHPHVALVPDTNRGIVYPVPTTFKGQAIAPAHPQSIGLLGLSYSGSNTGRSARTHLND